MLSDETIETIKQRATSFHADYGYFVLEWDRTGSWSAGFQSWGDWAPFDPGQGDTPDAAVADYFAKIDELKRKAET
jgi:hypothetical protein